MSEIYRQQALEAITSQRKKEAVEAEARHEATALRASRRVRGLSFGSQDEIATTENTLKVKREQLAIAMEAKGLNLTLGARGEDSMRIEGIVGEHEIFVEEWHSANPYRLDSADQELPIRLAGTLDGNPLKPEQVSMFLNRYAPVLVTINKDAEDIKSREEKARAKKDRKIL